MILMFSWTINEFPFIAGNLIAENRNKKTTTIADLGCIASLIQNSKLRLHHKADSFMPNLSEG
jgi:hypothetical protein